MSTARYTDSMWLYLFYEPIAGFRCFRNEQEALDAWKEFADQPEAYYFKVEAVTGHWDGLFGRKPG